MVDRKTRQSTVRRYVEKVFGDFQCLALSERIRNNDTCWLCKCIKCGHFDTKTSKQLTRTACRCVCSKPKYKEGRNRRCYSVSTVPEWWYNKLINRKKHSVEVSREYLEELYCKQNHRCALTGQPLKFERYQKEDNNSTSASLDRINSSKGYIEGNVQWVHKHVNMMKQKYSQEYFIQTCRAVADYADNKTTNANKEKGCAS